MLKTSRCLLVPVLAVGCTRVSAPSPRGTGGSARTDTGAAGVDTASAGQKELPFGWGGSSGRVRVDRRLRLEPGQPYPAIRRYEARGRISP